MDAGGGDAFSAPRRVERRWLLIANTVPRPHQREIILAALDGKDVFVQAATSFGKSLCFQLPAVIDRGSAFLDSRFLVIHKTMN